MNSEATNDDVFKLVMVTAPDMETARKLVQLSLEQRLVACGNIVPTIESHYWWQGKIERSDECLILFKTQTSLLAKLENHIQQNHPYETPECIALPISSGLESYLDWIRSETQPADLPLTDN